MVNLIFCTPPLVSIQNRFVSLNSRHFINFLTFLNAFLMSIPNIVTKFQNVDICETFVTFFNLSSAHACRVVSMVSVNRRSLPAYLAPLAHSDPGSPESHLIDSFYDNELPGTRTGLRLRKLCKYRAYYA